MSYHVLTKSKPGKKARKPYRKLASYTKLLHASAGLICNLVINIDDVESHCENICRCQCCTSLVVDIDTSCQGGVSESESFHFATFQLRCQDKLMAKKCWKKVKRGKTLI